MSYTFHLEIVTISPHQEHPHQQNNINTHIQEYCIKLLPYVQNYMHLRTTFTIRHMITAKHTYKHRTKYKIYSQICVYGQFIIS